MAAAKKYKKPTTQSKRPAGDTETTGTNKKIFGIVLGLIAVWLLWVVVAYYFTWQGDQSLARFGDLSRTTASQISNPGSTIGARTADFLVGQLFGVFAVALPLALLIIAVRMIIDRPTFFRKYVRVSLLIMILGSLSLGLIFGYKWDVFGTGLGGYVGITVSEWIETYIGVAGTGIALLLGWILTAIYINKKTVNVVSNAVDAGIRAGGAAIAGAADKIVHKRADADDAEDEESEPHVVKDAPELPPVFAKGNDTPQKQETKTQSADHDFEITKTKNDDEYGVFGFDTSHPESSASREEQPEPDVIVFGDDNAAARPIQQTPVKPSAPLVKEDIFEVVEQRGTPLSVGGVVESSARGGVKPGDKMEVVVAGRRDIELDEDEIDESLYDPTKELSGYQRPPVELLEDHSVDVQVTEEEIYDHKNHIVTTLENFGIKIDKIKATVGPTVTLYEIVPAAGVKISKIKNLEDDIALSLKALGIRIIAPMPGKGTVGIEVPNKDKEIVSMRSVIKTLKFQESNYELPVVLGKTISNETYMIDLAKMPHLLVAGATGQGKSVGLNAIITSLLYKKHPAELKFVLVDPKRVELSLYAKLERHFLAKMASEDEAILTDTQRVVYTLNALCQEMSDRYDLLRKAEVKKISEYNDKMIKRRLNPNKGHRFMPYIVVVVDEFADMIMTAGREIEAPITRLAQLARAVGIHLVIATQRPDVKVITGLIKANFPARIAFRVMSMVDSRTIIDQPGANQLIGRGDMLMSLNGELTRVQCAFIDTPEIERITEFIGNQRGYAGPYELPDYSPEGNDTERASDLGALDPMFEEVAHFVVQNQQGSTSAIQRRFSIGYNRAGRIMDQLEAAGIVGRAEGSKPREVLIMDLNSLEYLIGNLDK